MLRSATLMVGILLAGLAFAGFLLLGGMMAPPPYSVAVAVQDIPAYSYLDPNTLGVDAERINGQVAQTLILRDELDQYVGGFVLENIHAGEPLRKSAVVAPNNPQAISRLALVMTDPDKVAMVVPVDPKTAPAQIAPGDWVDLVVGLAPGNISAGSNSTFSNLLATPAPAFPGTVFGTPPTTGTARATPVVSPPLPTNNPLSNVGTISAGDMNLPADKVVIQNVPVLNVRFQQVPNPAFTGSGAGFGESPSSQVTTAPAYIQGDIQSVTVLVPRASVELLTFGMDNGRVHLVLLPAVTGQSAHGAQSPTFGITFNDVVAWMMRERASVARGQPLIPGNPPATSQPSPTPTISASLATPTYPAIQPTQPTPVPIQPTTQPKPTPAAPTTIPTGLDLGALLMPLSCGVVLLVLFVVAVRFIRQRRRDNGLV